jgi:hypothetical protein
MDAKKFSEFRHEAVHELKHLNEICEQEFRIGTWPRWDYDLNRGTLTFSKDGVPKVVALIQVVGTTSIEVGTWLWAWANASLPAAVTMAMEKVRAFGEAENLAELTQPRCADDEYLGWEMTAIAAKLLGAKGGYRCPGEKGFLYVVFSSLQFASEPAEDGTTPTLVQCPTHGSGFETFVCEHLVSDPAQRWYSQDPEEGDKWPDAWCAVCNAFFQQEGEWNDKNEPNVKVRLLCHYCYERLRAQGQPEAGRS